ncbi:DUF1499 domain-containing protein [Halobacillus hunanensis]|uniref:DUF1499 domain-containing protein n=1 Tax=Halobacillus hunanensis TaxID=578214 RepID=UPI0009A75408|nr:DUF1499 domain-containing protein [Halobacillus hunanensis]
MAKEWLGVRNGELAPCPNSPNCISTQAQRPPQKMESLPFFHDKDGAKNVILNIIGAEKGTEIQSQHEDYLHVVFTSKFLKFKDDVEFYFDQLEERVHFRSASRVGCIDFGVNRKRMERISKEYLDQMKGASS